MSAQRQALVLIDPLNDFLDPKGKLYSMVEESLIETNTVENIRKLVQGARDFHIPVYYGLHQQYKQGNYEGWINLRASHHRAIKLRSFSGWGGEIIDGLNPNPGNGDVVCSRHWNSSSFKNTDLDYQIRQRGITHLVIAGMVANTCVEATARDATELGYRVTLIKDATAGFSTILKDAATNVVWPTIVEEVMSVQEWLDGLNTKPQVRI